MRFTIDLTIAPNDLVRVQLTRPDGGTSSFTLYGKGNEVVEDAVKQAVDLIAMSRESFATTGYY